MNIAVWAMFGLVVVADAVIASSISLGLLYFVPIALASLLLSRREAIVMAILAAVSRVLFGPVGDPLGLKAVTLQLPDGAEPVVNAVTSSLAYLGITWLLIRLADRSREVRALDAQVTTDPLTGTHNRRALDRILAAGDLGTLPLSVLAIDVDHFKRVNDTHGHRVGDEVLVELARRLRAALRGSDLVVRTGGEEFVALLPGTGEAAARAVAARILETVRGLPFVLGDLSLPVTVSIGCATGSEASELLAAADRLLYDAKRAGRDRVAVAPAPENLP